MSTAIIPTQDGPIPVTRIARITTCAKEALPTDDDAPQFVEYTASDGATATSPALVTIRASDFSPTAPAPPGYEVLEVTPAPECPGGLDLVRTPILGWRIHRYRALPYTAEDLGDNPEIGIRAPSGRVYGPGSLLNETAEEWLQMMIARRGG